MTNEERYEALLQLCGGDKKLTEIILKQIIFLRQLPSREQSSEVQINPKTLYGYHLPNVQVKNIDVEVYRRDSRNSDLQEIIDRIANFDWSDTRKSSERKKNDE